MPVQVSFWTMRKLSESASLKVGRMIGPSQGGMICCNQSECFISGSCCYSTWIFTSLYVGLMKFLAALDCSRWVDFIQHTVYFPTFHFWTTCCFSSVISLWIKKPIGRPHLFTVSTSQLLLRSNAMFLVQKKLMCGHWAAFLECLNYSIFSFLSVKCLFRCLLLQPWKLSEWSLLFFCI